MQQLRFYFPQWLYSTCFGWQSHLSTGVHMLYMATGKPAHCNLTIVCYNNMFWTQQPIILYQLRQQYSSIIAENKNAIVALVGLISLLYSVEE